MPLPLLQAGKELLKDVVKGLIVDGIKDLLRGSLGGKKPPASERAVPQPPPFQGGQCVTSYDGKYTVRRIADGLVGTAGFGNPFNGAISVAAFFDNAGTLFYRVVDAGGAPIEGSLGLSTSTHEGVSITFERRDGLPDLCGNPPPIGDGGQTPYNNPRLPAPWGDGQDGVNPPPLVLLKAPSIPQFNPLDPLGNPPTPPEEPDLPPNKEDIYNIEKRLYDLNKMLRDFRLDMECVRKKICATEGYEYSHVADIEGTGTASLYRAERTVEAILVKVYEYLPDSSRYYADNDIFYNLGMISFIAYKSLLNPVRVEHTTQIIFAPDRTIDGFHWLLPIGVKASVTVVFARRE